MSLNSQHPMTIVARCLLLEQMRKINPVEIQKIAPEFTYQYDEIDEEGKDSTVVEINWEFALFDATMHQLQKLFNNFVEKKKKKESKELVDETAK